MPLALWTLAREARLLGVTELADDRGAVRLADHRDVCGVLADEALHVLGCIAVLVDKV